MESFLFSTKDIVKYLIVAGLIYSILKMIPSQQIANKDLILIMIIITVGFVSIDCMFFKNNNPEGFANDEEIEKRSRNDVDAQNNNSVDKVQTNAEVEDTNQQDSNRPRKKVVRFNLDNEITQSNKETNIDEISTSQQRVREEAAEPNTAVESKTVAEPKIACALEVEKVKRQLEDEIDELKVQLQTRTTQPGPNNKIANRYFESLMGDLAEKGLLDSNDIENIKIKMRSKLLTMEEIINSLETLKKEGKPKVPGIDGKIKDDKIYNELPSDFYSPLGDKIANEWDNEYTILNTNKWQVPMPRPPVCINTTPCKVCPSDSSNYPVNLKQWDDSRYVTSNIINKKWAHDQTDA